MKSIKINQQKILFFFLPVSYCLYFISNDVLKLNIPDLNAYVLTLIMMSISFKYKKGFFFNIIMLLFMFLSVVFQNQGSPISSKANYMLSFVFMMIFLNVSTYNKIWVPSHSNIVSIYFLIVITFFVSVIYNQSIYTHYLSNRIYIEGMIIPHLFQYYTSFLSYYFLRKKKYLLFVTSVIFTVIVGPRTGVLFVLIGFLINLKSLKKDLFKYIIPSSIILIGLLFIFTDIALLIDQFILQITNLRDLKLSSDLMSDDNADFSSYRSILLANYINYASETFYSLNTIWGNGSLSSLSFNESTLGPKIWMHNDIIEILFSWGLIGISLYIITISRFLLKYNNWFNILFFVIAIFLNGLFTYQIYPIYFVILKLYQDDQCSNTTI